MLCSRSSHGNRYNRVYFRRKCSEPASAGLSGQCLEGYTQISLTYFDDGILSDENGVIIDEPEDIVGDALNHFGEYEEDSVFVRSDPKRCDYEILRDLRSYAEFRSTLPPKI